MQSLLRPLGLSLTSGILALCAACNQEPEPFTCTAADQCGSGICQPTGFCSFPNAACESGQQYGDLAGDGLANTCVPPETADDDGTLTASDEAENTTDDSVEGGPSTGSEDGDTLGTTSSTTSGSTTGDSASSATTDPSGSSGEETAEVTGIGSATVSTDESGSGEDETTGGSTTTTADTSESTETGEPIMGDCFDDEFEGDAFSAYWNLGGNAQTSEATLSGDSVVFTVAHTRAESVVLTGIEEDLEGTTQQYVEFETGTVTMEPDSYGQLLVTLRFGEASVDYQLSRDRINARMADPDEENTWITVDDALFSATSHRFLRIRHTSASGASIVHWERSTDGIAWTNFTTEELPMALDPSAFVVEILGGTYMTSTNNPNDVFELMRFSRCTVE